MHEFLAEVYGTNSEAEVEKTAEAVLLDELEKVAEAEGIDLSELSNEDIVDILKEAMETAGVAFETDEAPEAEKVAEEVTEDDGELTEEDQEKLAEADFLGRMMAHAFNQELGLIGAEVEKTASAKEHLTQAMSYHLSKEASDDAIVERAQAILEAAAEAAAPQEKQASDEDALNQAALELLDAEGYDVDKILGALS